MILDESLSMRDEGLSAFHGRHVKHGALGVFLDAINAGRIPNGSVLIVEGLDRLSRADPIDAQAQLTQIINAGITVVTASDGKQYSRESLKANPMDIIYSVLVMVRANEESETKSKRAKAALRKHCEAWLETGQRRGGRHGKYPQWLEFENGEWLLRPSRVESIRLAIDMFRRGHGHVRIANVLADRNMLMTDGSPNSNQIYRIIRNPAIKGTKVIDIDRETYELPNYYPAIVTPHEFDQLQSMMDKRAITAGASIRKIPGIITGIGISFCGYCGGSMVAMNVASRAREDGTLSDGNRRIICSSRATRKHCDNPSSTSIVPIERAIMMFCSDQLNLSSLISGGDRLTPIRARLETAKSQAADLEQKLEKLADAMLAADDGAAPLVFIRKAREFEKQLAQAKSEAQSAERELASVSQASTPAMSEAWQALLNGVLTMDDEARLMARRLVGDTFERIAIFAKGWVPLKPSKTICIALTAKGGGSRSVFINRETGEWMATEDWQD